MSVEYLLLRAKWVIQMLRYQDGCWCEVSIGNPMMKDHSSACKAAQKFMEDIDGGDPAGVREHS